LKEQLKSILLNNKLLTLNNALIICQNIIN